jgi:hypothetical protein
MTMTLLGSFKHSLTSLGGHLSDRAIHRAQMVVNYMKLGRWMRDHGFEFEQRVSHREGVFDAVARQVRDEKVLYLEFGVFQGASMRYWSKALLNPASMLHGFDSFEGLPEDFCVGGGYTKGRFSTGGSIPDIDDHRVRFFKGWFDQVLPTYEVPPHDRLVINIDADLYSSTITVLNHLRPWIKQGTFIYFDDLSRPEHEAKAFDEFIQQTGLRFAPVCADQSLNTAFFECLG